MTVSSKIKTAFLCLFICFSCTLFAQDSLIFKQFFYSSGAVSSEGFLRKGKPDGYWKSFNEKGELVSEGNRKNYLLDSVWKFYKDSQLTTLITYAEGKKNGLQKTFTKNDIIEEYFFNDIRDSVRKIYFLNGNLKKITFFENVVEQGLEKEFDTSGTIVCMTVYRNGFVISRDIINRKDKFGLKQGMWRFFYPDSDVFSLEGTYLNDKKNGYFKSFDTAGILIKIEKYINDELETQAPELQKMDVRTDYYPNGQPKVVAAYNAEGKPEGVRREYDTAGKIIKSYTYENGKIKGEGIVDARGRAQGFWQEFYPDGKLKASGNYRNGNRTGEWKFFFENGKLEQEGEYDNKGKYSGEWRWYHADGSLHVVQNYLDGKADGEMTEYDDNGRIIAQGDYIEGTEEGFWYVYTGKEYSEGKYHAGEKKGAWKSYFDRDKKQLSFSGGYKDGNPDGFHTYYYPNGKVREEGRYRMGERDGTWRKYDEGGNLYVRVVYKKGEEIRYDNVRIDAYLGN